VVAWTHKTLIWDRTRTVQRLRHQLREYFPTALEAFEDLDALDVKHGLALFVSQCLPAWLGQVLMAGFSDARRRGGLIRCL
jgi:hypothetical protein